MLLYKENNCIIRCFWLIFNLVLGWGKLIIYFCFNFFFFLSKKIVNKLKFRKLGEFYFNFFNFIKIYLRV